MTTETSDFTKPALPSADGKFFLTDGGIETTLIFHDNIDLPMFASFVLLDDDEGRAKLTSYFNSHIATAKAHGLGFVLESPTWRASKDWGEKLGYSADRIAQINAEAIYLMRTLRNKHGDSVEPFVISGCIGPRGDGYDPGEIMSEDEAHRYHQHQVTALAEAGADLVSGITINNVPEAIGIVRAARSAKVPVAMSLTVETDGRLPTGQTLKSAIEEIDTATDRYARYFMINCAHPDHFEDGLRKGGDWVLRIAGIRANASRMSHAELDESEVLDDGNPQELGEDYARLLKILPNLRVLGGCCGTDHRHVDAMGHAVCQHVSMAVA